ncbi:MAG: hypothetical protein HYY01_01640 [Chloroflexi bacterium]|nr:hypothetical protein [Chloroflexota bacterium]
MTYFMIRYDVVSGKTEAHDQFVRETLLPFWKRQPGVTSCCILEDTVIGWPERTIMIGANDLHDLEVVLKQPLYRAIKGELLVYTSNIQGQFLTIREGSLAA